MLKVDNVSKSFGGIQALKDCTLEVESGTITGLIGPNGAGKTTLFNVISGLYVPDRGSVYFKGENITELEPHQIFERNIFRTFQITRELEEVTVLENLLLMPEGQIGESFFSTLFRKGSIQSEEKENKRKALEVLEFLDMESKSDILAKNLPSGEKKLLDIGRMMMVSPELVLLDEPGAGIPPSIQKRLNEYIRRLNREEGITFFIIEHDMSVIMNICDDIVVLADGTRLTEGSPEEVKENPKVIEAYLGSNYARK